jgi:ADP-ribose pyrophosphatase
METWKNRESVYRGKIFNVDSGPVTLSDGQEAIRDIVVHPGGVGVVPYTGTSVILVRQYRIAVAQDVLEIPAGKLEGDESPEARGRAELIEEAGVIAGEMLPIGHILPSVGFLSEKIHLFIATDLERTEATPEWDEEIEIIEMPVEEIRDRLKTDYFVDAKTIAGLHRLLHHIDSRK